MNIYYVIHIHLVHNFQNVQDLLHFQEGRFDVSFNLKQLHFGNKVVLFLFITIQADCIALSREEI